MAELRRLGEMVDFDSDYRAGDKRVIPGLNNLGKVVLSSDDIYVATHLYITSSPIKKVKLPEFLYEIEIGEYEGAILDKLIHPVDPVLCIKGRMGSGKTTVMRYLMENFVSKFEYSHLGVEIPAKRLTAWLDFKNFVTETKADTHDLLEIICIQLWNKCIYFVDENFEFHEFWDYLLSQNEISNDGFIEQVVGSFYTEYPEIRNSKVVNGEEIIKRKEVKLKLREKNIVWYLRYLILLYRYLLQTRFLNHRECALIILDNVDSLPIELQRSLIRVVIGSAHKQGPIFVVLVRPETFDRSGINDVLRDVVNHQNPEPYLVLLNRFTRFLETPRFYFNSSPSLTTVEREVIYQYISNVVPIMQKSKAFIEFSKSIAGKSTRNLFALAQGLFMLPVEDYKESRISPISLILAMIKHGSRQFQPTENKWISSIFNVKGATEGRYLMKLRILRYIANRGGRCMAAALLSAISSFDLPEGTVYQALNELLYNECQLLTSNESDFVLVLGEEPEEFTITEIGLGYINNLIYNLQFVQELILDANVPSNFPLSQSYIDKDCMRMGLLINFLDEIYKSDIVEVKAAISKVELSTYIKIFGAKLLSLELITAVHEHINNIVSMKKKNSKIYRQDYDDVILLIEGLLHEATNANHSLFGVTP